MKDYYPKTYGIAGGLFSLQAVYLIFVSLMAKSAPPMITLYDDFYGDPRFLHELSTSTIQAKR